MESTNNKVRIENILELLNDSLKLEERQIPNTAKETIAKIVIFGTEIGS